MRSHGLRQLVHKSYCQNLLSTDFLQVVLTSCNKLVNDKLQQAIFLTDLLQLMTMTSLLQFVDNCNKPVKLITWNKSVAFLAVFIIQNLLSSYTTSAFVLTGGRVGRSFLTFFSSSNLNVTRGFLEDCESRKHGFTLRFFARADRTGNVSGVGAIRLLSRESAIAHSMEEDTEVDEAGV